MILIHRRGGGLPQNYIEPYFWLGGADYRMNKTIESAHQLARSTPIRSFSAQWWPLAPMAVVWNEPISSLLFP
jgi:hypothetical protein